jgi:hypothetical protein
MATPTTSSLPTARRSENTRWMIALGLVTCIVVGCIVIGQVLARRVADPTPHEIQSSLGSQTPPPLDKLIEQFNRMDIAQRRELSMTGEFRNYTAKLSPEERLKFVRQTMDRGIQDQIERYRKMNKEERSEFIEQVRERQKKAREDLQNATPEEKQRVRAMLESGNLQDTIERAVQEFLKVTSSEERAELEPLYSGALENINFAKSLK